MPWDWCAANVDQEIPKGLIHLFPFWAYSTATKGNLPALVGDHMDNAGAALGYKRTQQGFAIAADGGGRFQFTAADRSNLSSLDQGTVIMGTMPRTGVSAGGLFEMQQAATFNNEFAWSGATSPQFRIKQGSTTILRVNFPSSFTLNQCHVMAIAGGPAGNMLYLNGRRLRGSELNYLTGSASTTAWMSTPTTITEAGILGNNFPGSGITYDDLQDVFWLEIYDRHLSEAEILYRLNDLYAIIRQRRIPYNVTGGVERLMEASIASVSTMLPDLKADREMSATIASDLAMTADLSIGGIVTFAVTINSALGNIASLEVDRVYASTIATGLTVTPKLNIDRDFAAAIASELGSTININMDRGFSTSIMSMLGSAISVAIERTFGTDIATDLSLIAKLQVSGLNDVILQATITSELGFTPNLRISPFAPIEELQNLNTKAPWDKSDEADKLRFLVDNFDAIRQAFIDRPSGSFETTDGKVIVIKNGVVTEIYEK